MLFRNFIKDTTTFSVKVVLYLYKIGGKYAYPKQNLQYENCKTEDTDTLVVENFQQWMNVNNHLPEPQKQIL